MQNAGSWTKLDDWVRQILVDPFGKGPLIDDAGSLRSGYGSTYRQVDGIWDFRRRSVDRSRDSVTWQAGQDQYETWSRDLIENDAKQDYVVEIEGIRDVYKEIPLRGRVLDVGGHQGRLREFLTRDQEYLSCDPFIGVFNGTSSQENLLKAYRCFEDPCNFLACQAEHLPLQELTFDCVHMRSVVDHFRDPALAMIEAYRVLRPGGALVVGLYVDGGKDGRATFRECAKEAVRAILPWIGIRKYADHHVWHPTYAELRNLIEESGFAVRHVHWQKGWSERVCYIDARKV